MAAPASSDGDGEISAPPPFLQVVYASHDLSLVSDGLGTNKPVVRKRGIIEALRTAANARATCERDAHRVEFTVITEPAPSLKPAERIHDPLMVELFATGWERWAALGPMRDLYFSTEGRVRPDAWQQLVPSQVAPRDPYQRPGKNLHGAVCFFAQDAMTPLTEHTSRILHHDLAVTLRAVEMIQQGEARQVYACNTEPGHHSGRQSYGGYCFINQAALAASLLQESHEKVGFLDIDYHAGNGSMSLFYSNSNVFFASLHADPEIEYPYCCGWADQTGEGEGEGTTINVPMPKGTTWKEYRPELARCLAAIKAFGAKALVVSLGVDTIAADPEAAPLAGFQLHAPDYTEMGEMVRALGLPTIWVQEGGYKLDDVSTAVRNVVMGDDEAVKKQ